MPPEDRQIRLRRLRMRSWRRGMKEMDLILGRFSDGPMHDLGEADLTAYEALMSENDQDLYLWVTARLPGRDPADDGAPEHLRPILTVIAAHAGRHLGPAA